MNAIATQLRAAGVAVPSVRYRIWNWLKDHPEKTAEDITTALGSGYSFSGTLSEMEKRGMVKVYSDISRKKTGLAGVQYKVKRYSVVNAEEFEDLPMPKKPKLEQVRVTGVRTISPTPLAPQPTAPGPLTEAEEFAAYLEFKAMKKAMRK